MEHIVFDKLKKIKSCIDDRVIFLARHGSHAYGTSTPESDEDFKGIAIPPKEYYLGCLKKFEQQEFKEPDTVIYEIKKFFNLATNCNPNIIEVLHTDESDHVYVSKLGRIILDNKDKFLSKRIRYTFSGYAISQLKRIETHRRWLLNPPKTFPTRLELGLPEKTLIPQDQLAAAQAEIQKDLDRVNLSFIQDLDEGKRIGLKTVISDMLAEYRITTDQQWLASTRRIGFDDNFIYLMQKEREYTSRKREFEQFQNWKENRNPKRAELEEKYGYDTKHGYHLIRLMRMCREILETGKVIVKRPDREELLAIRNGAWSYEKLMDFAKSEDKALDEIYKTSQMLPHSPDTNEIDKLCVSLVEEMI